MTGYSNSQYMRPVMALMYQEYQQQKGEDIEGGGFEVHI